MFKRDKIPWIIAWIIGGIIFVTWFFNLDYLWKGKQSADTFIQSIQEAVHDIGKGFKEFGKVMQGQGLPDTTSSSNAGKDLQETLLHNE